MLSLWTIFTGGRKNVEKIQRMIFKLFTKYMNQFSVYKVDLQFTVHITKASIRI